MWYRIDEERVTHEQIDGEVVALNLQTGSYFSLTGTSAFLWSRLERAARIEDLLRDLSARYLDCPADARGDVGRFLEQLAEAGLLGQADGGDDEAPPNADEPTTGYAPPAFEGFDDLRDLLLVDPIHEAGPDGWPSAEAAA